MISVGIDVSKGKSTICILKPYGEIVSSPFDVEHTDNSLLELSKMLLRLDGETKVVMEATGAYHMPILSYLKDQGLFVSVRSSVCTLHENENRKYSGIVKYDGLHNAGYTNPSKRLQRL